MNIANVKELVLPEKFDGLAVAQEVVMYAEARLAFLPEYLGALDKFAPDLRDRVENSRQVTPKMLLASDALAVVLKVDRSRFDGQPRHAVVDGASRELHWRFKGHR